MEHAEATETSAERAVKAAGSQAELCRILELPQSTVNSWLRRGTELPAQYVLPVERATGVSRHDLRPDLYPRDESPLPARQAAGQPPEPSSCPGSSQGSGGPPSPAPCPSTPDQDIAA